MCLSVMRMATRGRCRTVDACWSAGRRCRIVGTVCMDWVFVDVTGLPDVGPGEEVVVMGTQKGETITADEIGEQAGTIPYEILCNVSRRITRCYVS